jgi:hypothetical protein
MSRPFVSEQKIHAPTISNLEAINKNSSSVGVVQTVPTSVGLERSPEPGGKESRMLGFIVGPSQLSCVRCCDGNVTKIRLTIHTRISVGSKHQIWPTPHISSSRATSSTFLALQVLLPLDSFATHTIGRCDESLVLASPSRGKSRTPLNVGIFIGG